MSQFCKKQYSCARPGNHAGVCRGDLDELATLRAQLAASEAKVREATKIIELAGCLHGAEDCGHAILCGYCEPCIFLQNQSAPSSPAPSSQVILDSSKPEPETPMCKDCLLGDGHEGKCGSWIDRVDFIRPSAETWNPAMPECVRKMINETRDHVCKGEDCDLNICALADDVAVHYAPAAPAQAVEFCEWSYDDGPESWGTDCGQIHTFNEGSPADNGFKCCPYCSRPVQVVDKKDIITP